MGEIVNVEMAENWDGVEGVHWAAHQARFDRSVAPHHRRLMAAAGIAAGERILDIGCGNGQTTRDAARAAASGESGGPGGSALGVDLSGPMLARGRELAAEEGVGNVTFEQADVQVHPFEPATFDLVMSRFGVMFFSDMVAAFSNLASAVRPGGRLAMLVWQAAPENAWVMAFRAAVAAGRDLPLPPPGVPGPFALADRSYTTGLLEAAGFSDVAYEDSRELFNVGTDAEDAYSFVSGLFVVQALLADLDDEARAGALKELKAALAAHETADGVVFDSATWVVTARR